MASLKKYLFGLAGVIANMPQPIFIVDETGVIRYLNERATEHLGYAEHELLGTKIADIITPAHRRSFTSSLNIMLGPFDSEHRYKSLNISALDKHHITRPINAVIVGMLDDDQNPHAWVRFDDSVKVTKQRRTKRQIESATTSHDIVQAFNGLGEPVVMFNTNWQYIFINKIGLDILGRKKDDVIGKNVWDMFPHLAHTEFKRAAQEAMRTQQTIRIEEFYPHDQKWYVTHFYPTPDALMSHMKDITTSKYMEQVNEQLTGTLEQAMDVYWSESNKAKRHAAAHPIKH